MQTTTLLITGAGGTVGRLLIDHFLKDPAIRIKALERSEMAMADLINIYGNNSRVELLLADLLDIPSYRDELKDCNAIIHCAALKHVIIGKHFPERQAYENVTAFCNLIREARNSKIQRFLFCSTDKAAQPTGVMGASKHLLEFICRDAATPTFATGAVRFANIIGSNGSLLHVIQNRLKDGKDIILRDKRMTRYFLRPQDATELIAYALTNLQKGEVFIRDTPTARIEDVINVTMRHHDIPLERLKVSTEPTYENIHERLIAPDEILLTRKISQYFIIGGDQGVPLTNKEQERALSSSVDTISKQKIQELLYAE